MKGDHLKTARIEKGWSQRELARRSNVAHHAVRYWEKKSALDPRGYAVLRMAEALGWLILGSRDARARHGVLERAQEYFGVRSPKTSNATSAREMEDDIKAIFEGASRRRLLRILVPRIACGARTRSGRPCKAKSEPGRKRCRMHGGLSTGPKTEAGRDRIADAQRRRWQKARATTL